MNFSWWTFALQAANFLILVWLLRRFLFKPVSAIVARRKEEIARQLSEVSAEKQAALHITEELRSQKAAVEGERREAIEEERAQLAIERSKMLEEARAEANEISVQARKKIAEERAAATEELFSRTVELATGLAEGFLREVALPSMERLFLARMVDYIDRLPAEERANLVSHLGSNTLVVTTAHQLDANEEAEWRDQLGKRIGNSATLKFHADPALIMGAEITFPNAILRFSWRESLAEAVKEFHRNEHSG